MVQMCQMRKMATFGVGATLNQSCCYGYQSSDGNIFSNVFSIKHQGRVNVRFLRGPIYSPWGSLNV